MYNRLTLQCRLIRDPKSGQGPKSTWAIFRVANNRGSGDKAKAVFIDVFCYARTADRAAKWLKKGTVILASGVLETEAKDDERGKRTEWKLIADDIELLSGARQEGEQSEDQSPAEAQSGQGGPDPEESPAPAPAGGEFA